MIGAPARTRLYSPQMVIGIGASIGGITALETILRCLPATTPGMVITQHMPPTFTRQFADRLDHFSALSVREARHGDVVTRGVALIAPGDHHLVLNRDGARYVVTLQRGPRVNHFCPSVDVMFQSLARVAGESAVGVLLTGMGADGARGLLTMRQVGARTIAQDAETSVVFGMPKAAIELGAVQRVFPLGEIAAAILEDVHRASNLLAAG